MSEHRIGEESSDWVLAYYGTGNAGPFLSLSFVFCTALEKATLYLHFLLSNLGSKGTCVVAEREAR